MITFESTPGLDNVCITRYRVGKKNVKRVAVEDDNRIISIGNSPQHATFANNVQTTMEENGYEPVYHGEGKEIVTFRKVAA